MKRRLVIATVTSLLAVFLGLAAPEPSTAAIYRSTVLSFSFLLFFSRCISMGAIASGNAITHTVGIRSGRVGYYVPRFVTDPGFAIGSGY